MHLVWAMTKGVDRYTLFEPLSHLLRPAIQKLLVHLHARVAYVAHEGKIGGNGELFGKAGKTVQIFNHFTIEHLEAKTFCEQK